MFEIQIERERPRVSGQGSRSVQAEIDTTIREFLEEMAIFAEEAFRAHVPVGDTLGIYDAIYRDRVKKKGDFFNVEVGIGPVEPVPPGVDPNYPLYVDQGTGLWGPEHDLIYPQHGNVLVFTVSSSDWVIPNRRSGGNLFDRGPGQEVFTRYIEGQKPQHFSEKVDEETEAFFKIKKRELAQILSKIIANHVGS
jgi:hypothetical protein